MGLFGGLLGGLFGGGGDGNGIGNSKSQQTNSTESSDLRIVSGADSTNSTNKINIDGSNNTVTATDFGAVSQSLKLAMAGIEAANIQARETVAANGHLLEGVIGMTGAQSKQHAADLMAVKTGDTRTIVLAGAAVAGLALIAVMKKGKA